MNVIIILISLHFATIFNGLMSQREEATYSKIAAIEMHSIIAVVCFGILMFNYGFYGLILFTIDLLVSLYLIKIKKINFILLYYLKCDIFVPILCIIYGIIKTFL